MSAFLIVLHVFANKNVFVKCAFATLFLFMPMAFYYFKTQCGILQTMIYLLMHFFPLVIFKYYPILSYPLYFYSTFKQQKLPKCCIRKNTQTKNKTDKTINAHN